MGIFRLVLAVMVAMSHMDIYFKERNLGIIAVVSFLLLSGYVMTALINKHYSSAKMIPSFYLDRVIRLYPQFLFYFAICSILAITLLPGSKAANAVNFQNIASSLAIIPMGYYMYGVTTPEIIPPAWSLGLEATFYLLFPLLLILKLRRVTFILSITIFTAACCGIIDTDIYGYRLLPGVLFIFLIGSFIISGSKIDKLLIAIALGLSISIYIGISIGAIEKANYNLDVTAGLIVGLPVIYFLSMIRHHKIDEFFGNISYGIFLNHFVFMHIAHYMGIKIFSGWQAGLLITCSFLLSVASYYLIERPALRLRHKLRSQPHAVSGMATTTVLANNGSDVN